MGGNSQQQTQNSRSNSHTAPWGPQQGHLTGLWGAAQNQFNQGPPGFFPGQTFAGPSQYTNQGINQLANYQGVQSNPLYGLASGYLGNALGGQQQGNMQNNLGGIQGFLGSLMGGMPNMPQSYDQFGYGNQANYVDPGNKGKYPVQGDWRGVMNQAREGMQQGPAMGGQARPGGYRGMQQIGAGGGYQGLTGGQPVASFDLGGNFPGQQNSHAAAGMNPTMAGYPQRNDGLGGTMQQFRPNQASYHWLRRQ